MIDQARNIQFSNFEITHTGTSAIWFRGSYSESKVKHCYLQDLGVDGVKIGELQISDNDSLITRNIIVDNKIIRSMVLEYPTGVDNFILNERDNTISHNEKADFIYSGISVGWVWGYKFSPIKKK